MGDVVIRAEGLGKQYRIGPRQARPSNLRERLTQRLATVFQRLVRNGIQESGDDQTDTIWALKGVSFEVKQGEVLGIIGRNGSGKSTLLRILSRITEPTEGIAEIHGVVGSLLEVGTGFHSELTGRENIYLSGAILGLTKAEIDRQFDEIVAFAEVEKFVDTPVKYYSSGMHVRLAFAVAAQLEPEILLVDEVLAVGDAAFQKKCLGKMRAVGQDGRTILFVSHNMGAIAELCTRAVLLDHGRQIAQGEVSSVLEAYSTLNNKNEPRVHLPEDTSLPCAVVELRLCNEKGLATCTFDVDEGIILSIVYRVRTKLHGLQVVATLSRNMVEIVHSFDTDGLSQIPPREPGLYLARYKMPKMFLKAGIYTVRITTGTAERRLQDLESALLFDIEERSVNTYMRGYRRDRPGHVISPGIWETTRLE